MPRQTSPRDLKPVGAQPSGNRCAAGPVIGLLICVAVAQVAPLGMRPASSRGGAAEQAAIDGAVVAKPYLRVELPNGAQQGEFRQQEAKPFGNAVAVLDSVSSRWSSSAIAASSQRSMLGCGATLVGLNVRLQI
ncbi:hypothetical protein [Rosistilla oblonga]|uniref:hypothetical protein n=1 Tax=Rosistilla oblonga TaxID=2527990 RepID=UPI003A97F403